jgi:VWFA-related protein
MRSLLLLLPAIAFALPPQRPESATPVNLNVVALDAKGQSVMDLTVSEFRVSDNGKAQTIASFRKRESQILQKLMGPGQFANRSDGIPHATVILFDLMNMQFGDRGYVVNQLTHALQQMESGENLYLYLITVNGGLLPVRPLPGSGGDTSAKAGAWPGDIQTRLSEAMRVAGGLRPADLDIDSRVRTTFAALSMVAARLAAVPGRKTMVWLTHGVPITLSPSRSFTGDWVDYSSYIRQLSNTLDRADVSIYAVQQSPPGSTETLGSNMSRSVNGTIGAAGETSSPTAGMGSEQTLDEFASLTGGRAYTNNDIAGAIKQAMNDARQSYLISYSPPVENWDGKYHKIRVTCTRKGVRLQARQGYLAVGAAAAGNKQAADDIEAAIQSPFDEAEIGLSAAVTPQEGTPPVMRISLRIELSDVQLTQSGDVFTGQLAARFIEYQDDGTLRQSKPASLHLHLTLQQRDVAMKEGYPVAEDLEIAAHTEKIRAIIFDPNSGAIGSLSIPVSK